MTSFINRKHKQTIVYWSRSGVSGFGQTSFATPVEIMGRWEDKETRFIDNTGAEDVSDAVAFVGQDVVVGDWLFLGELTDIDSSIDETDPNNVSGAKEIKAKTKIPTLKADKFERKAFLKAS